MSVIIVNKPVINKATFLSLSVIAACPQSFVSLKKWDSEAVSERFSMSLWPDKSATRRAGMISM